MQQPPHEQSPRPTSPSVLGVEKDPLALAVFEHNNQVLAPLPQSYRSQEEYASPPIYERDTTRECEMMKKFLRDIFLASIAPLLQHKPVLHTIVETTQLFSSPTTKEDLIEKFKHIDDAGQHLFQNENELVKNFLQLIWQYSTLYFREYLLRPDVEKEKFSQKILALQQRAFVVPWDDVRQLLTTDMPEPRDYVALSDRLGSMPQLRLLRDLLPARPPESSLIQHNLFAQTCMEMYWQLNDKDRTTMNALMGYVICYFDEMMRTIIEK